MTAPTCDMCPNPATHGHLCAGDAWAEDVARYRNDDRDMA